MHIERALAGHTQERSRIVMTVFGRLQLCLSMAVRCSVVAVYPVLARHCLGTRCCTKRVDAANQLDDQLLSIQSIFSVLAHSPEVEFCGYSLPHPSERKIHLRLQTRGAFHADASVHVYACVSTAVACLRVAVAREDTKQPDRYGATVYALSCRAASNLRAVLACHQPLRSGLFHRLYHLPTCLN